MAVLPGALDGQRAVLRTQSPAEHSVGGVPIGVHPTRSPGRQQTFRYVADQLRAKWAKLGAFIDEGEADVQAHMEIPVQHRTKTHSTNPIERLDKEVKRRANVVGIFPNEGSSIRLIGAVLLESNDERQRQHRYMPTEPTAELTPPLIEAVPTETSTVAA